MSSTDRGQHKYVPALKYFRLTPLYDPLIRWTMGETTFRRRLIKQAQLREGYNVLDLGCGTATLTIMIKKMHPDVEIVGIDGDHKILEIARNKVDKAGLKIKLDHGLAFALPYPDDSFDRVFSSLLFHHLTSENKLRTLGEVLRVLRPKGELHAADFGEPKSLLMYLLAQIMRRFENTTDNIKGRLPEMYQQTGFDKVEETARFDTLFGTLSIYQGQKPV